jgi:hypothetical protein
LFGTLNGYKISLYQLYYLLLTNCGLKQQEKLYQALQPHYALASQMLHNSLKDLTCHTPLVPLETIPVDIDTLENPFFFFLSFFVVTKTTPFDALFPNKAVELIFQYRNTFNI